MSATATQNDPRIHLHMADDMKRYVRIEAAKLGVSMSEMVRLLVIAHQKGRCHVELSE